MALRSGIIFSPTAIGNVKLVSTVWLYFRFNLSHRDIEDLLAERGITVSREAIRLWCIKFGPSIPAA